MAKIDTLLMTQTAESPTSPWARPSQMYHSEGPAEIVTNLKLSWEWLQDVMIATPKE